MIQLISTIRKAQNIKRATASTKMSRFTVSKTNIAMENLPFVDVLYVDGQYFLLYRKREFPIAMFVYRRVCHLSNEKKPLVV